MSQMESEAARIAVIYYSATGTVHKLAEGVAAGAEEAGAEVRLRQVPELFPELVISQSQHWGKHRSETQDQAEATLDDLAWADGFAFGTPTRFGNVAAQLKMYMDQAGSLWEQGLLVNKVGTAFTASQTAHGGQESTILALNNSLYHWGAIVLPLGYTVSEVYNGGGNPYGASFVTEGGIHGGPDEHAIAVARAQGRRLTQVASAIAAARRQGLLGGGAGVVRDPLAPAGGTAGA
jgi:NAD(P)H dehydrogenase (quinone)